MHSTFEIYCALQQKEELERREARNEIENDIGRVEARKLERAHRHVEAVEFTWLFMRSLVSPICA